MPPLQLLVGEETADPSASLGMTKGVLMPPLQLLVGERTADPSASLGMTKGVLMPPLQLLAAERTADPSASLGMTKGVLMPPLQLLAGGENSRSLGFARDDKGSADASFATAGGGRTADPSASLGMTKMGGYVVPYRGADGTVAGAAAGATAAGRAGLLTALALPGPPTCCTTGSL